MQALTLFSDTDLSLSPTLCSAHGFSKPVLFREPCMLLEYLFRAPCNTLLLMLPADDDKAMTLLQEVVDLPLMHPPRLYLITDRIIPFPLPSSVIDCFQLPTEPETILSRMQETETVSVPPLLSSRLTDRICSESLLQLGVSPRLQGYEMLRLGVQFLLLRPITAEMHIMTDLYPVVAKQTGTSVSKVEHAMRNAIETAWMRADYNELEAFIGYTTRESKPTPSNSAFLYMLAERVRMRLEGFGQTDSIAKQMLRFGA